jgi:hypothetical protein
MEENPEARKVMRAIHLDFQSPQISLNGMSVKPVKGAERISEKSASYPGKSAKCLNCPRSN